MGKVRGILGLPVLDKDKGSQIAVVDEVVVDLKTSMLYGMLLSTCDGSSKQYCLLHNDIQYIGMDAVMVKPDYCLQITDDILATNSIYLFSCFTDKPIYTEAGINLGTLIDILYNKTTGELTFYEISDGILTDFLEGRKWMPFPPAQVIGTDKLIVPESMQKLLQDTLFK